MSKEKSLVEDAIIQMKNLEEAIAENAKGILASTMGQEIKELVKESLNESDEEEEEEVEDEVDSNLEDEDSEEGDDDTDNIDVTSDVTDIEMSDDNLDISDDDTIDMTGHDVDDVLKVYELMGPNDEFVVVKDDSGNLNVKASGKEYMIVQEGDEEQTTMEDTNMEDSMEMEETQDYSDETIQDIVDSVFSKDSDDEVEVSDDEEIVYEIEMDEDSEEEVMEDSDEEYSDEEEVMESYDEEESYEEEVMEDSDEEDSDEEEVMEESKMSIKPKGLGIGSPKFKYDKKPNTSGGFDVVKKKANKTMGTGKAKFEYKEGENMDGKMKSVKKMETKEASRTLGTGRYFGKKGLPKPKAAPRHLRVESVENELNLLRDKNEEYKNALNVFRNKLNEVAVFNSNLAYATRLFTEHSTSKQEKINILKRFDNVESLKESKNLYKQIKDELSNESSKPVNESFERIVENTQASGSAVNLIESKTYENPQFLRMKDLMSKLK